MENQMGNGPLMDADGNADGKPDGIRTADGDLVSADVSGLKTQIAISGKSRENGGGDWVAIGTRFQE